MATCSIPSPPPASSWPPSAPKRRCANTHSFATRSPPGWPARPAGTRVFEIDQPDVLAAKEKLLAAAVPTCQRRAVGIDLANDWPAALQSAGFDPTERTAWIIEGLLQYLDEAAVAPLFARVDALSASGSRLHYDVVGRSLLESPAVAGMLRMMSDLGAPWRFGTDDPAALVEPRGWDAEVTEPAIVGNRLGRWPFPPAPPGTPGVPRGYLVDAAKR